MNISVYPLPKTNRSRNTISFLSFVICVYYLHPVFSHPLIFSFSCLLSHIFITLHPVYISLHVLARFQIWGEYEWFFSFWDCVTLLNITYRVYPFSYKLCDHVFSLVLSCVCVCVCVSICTYVQLSIHLLMDN